MSTRKQRAANRKNAQHSTGPKTEAGKQRSSQNALKHGLLAVQSVIPGEDPAEYDKLLVDFGNRFLPSDPYERSLVRQMADAEWRLRRISRLESAFLKAAAESSQGKAENPDPDGPETDTSQFLGRAMQIRTADMARFAAYETHLARRQRQARDELRKSREKREHEIQLAQEADRQGRPYGDEREHLDHDSEVPPTDPDQPDPSWRHDASREPTRYRPTATESATSDPPGQNPSDESAA